MSKTVVIVGVGALGSHLVQFLRSEDVKIRVIDFDRVETKNLMSQLHAKSTVSRNKAESIKKTMHFLFGTKLDAIPHKLTLVSVPEMVDNADLVVDCLDNGASRKILQDYVRSHDVPCLHGASGRAWRR